MQFLASALILSSLASSALASPFPGYSNHWKPEHEHKTRSADPCTTHQSSSSAAKNTYHMPESTYKKGHAKSTPTPGVHSARSTYISVASKPASTGSPASTGKPVNTGNTTVGTGNAVLGIPAGSMTSKGGIPFGFLPDSANGGTMAKLNSATGKKAATYGWYSQITGSSYDDSQLTDVLNDVVASGAVFIPAVMPTKVKFADIDGALASQIASAMQTFTDKGVEVWLRFAHEVNYYVTDGTYAGGSAAEFVTAWQTVANAVKGNPKVKMFWSPNSADSGSLAQWFPGEQYVDVVGMDVYPKTGSSFASVYGDFYNAFAAKYNIPFAIGETGSGSYDTASKEEWLKEITNSDFSAYPLYKAACWFEYEKGGDFKIVSGESSSVVQETLSNF